MLKKIALAVVAVVAVLIVVIASRPAEFRIERQKVIAAPGNAVFAQVNDFQKWAAWSPWDKKDPGMVKNYAGAPGVGQTYHWVGNKDVGEGRMAITESQPDSLIRIRLEFLKPFEATNTTIFTFTPEGSGTRVSWAMQGHNNFLSKAMGLVMDMDKMVGPDFEQGLASLEVAAKAAAETAVPPAAPTAGPTP